MERVRASVWGWVFFWLACALMLAQAVSLYERGAKAESDVGVFYRTARLLDEGAGGEVYEGRDSVTGWPISIPPVGMAFFVWTSRLGPAGMTLVWAAFNLLVAGLAVWCLQGLIGDRLFPWMAAVFLVLGSASVQVGQFSLLFVACWVFALRFVGSTWLWALPTAIKLYPAIMFLSPVTLAGDWRRALKTGLALLIALGLLFFLVPLLFFGERSIELNASFVDNVALDPSGRVKWMQALGTTANQSLDSVLIRYLSWYPKFHEEHTFVPTLRWELDSVRLLGHGLRFVVLVVTLLAALRRKRDGFTDALAMAALWSAALYVMLPETRARYCVYLFLAFVPLASWVIHGERRVFRVAVFTAVLLFSSGILPKPLEVVGAGFLGALGLWLFNLRWKGPPRSVASIAVGSLDRHGQPS